MQPIIFVDMDGVLVDLKKGLSDYFQKDLTQLPFDEWNKYFYTFSDQMSDAALAQFYCKLPPTAECFDIWNTVKGFKALILTSISNRMPAIYGKELWCFTNLQIPSDKVFCSRNSAAKVEFASKKGLLIDDNKKNIEDWMTAGGTAIHHTDPKSTISQIKEFLSKTWEYDVFSTQTLWPSPSA